MALQKIKDMGKLLGEYSELRPDIRNLLFATRMRKQINSSGIDKIKAADLAKTFLEFDLQEPFKDSNNEKLAKQILGLVSMSSPEDVKKVQFLVNLNNNNLIDLFGI